MAHQLRLFFTALAYFTRIPCTQWAGHDAASLNGAARYFPLVGAVVGIVAAGIYAIAIMALPGSLAILLSMVGTLWLTGAFHEDGLSDTVDGLGGGWEKDQVLAIMKDSRVGSFGAIALVMALVIKFESLSQLDPLMLPWVLVAGHALSRFGAVVVIHTQAYVREQGKAKPLVQRIGHQDLIIAAVGGLLPLAVLPMGYWLALLPVVAAWLWFAHVLKRRLGGYTGDGLGAMQQLCELAFYLGVVACS